MTEVDDFPLSPGCWADSFAYYEAFVKAEKIYSALPARNRGERPDREIYNLTTQLYGHRSTSDVLFRSTLGAAEAQTAVWLSRVRIVAEWYSAAIEVPEFTGLSKDDLKKIAKLSALDHFAPKLETTLLKRGIVLVHERSIAAMKVDGATFKLASGNPVVAISLRYPRLDHYWFTLMHELAHVVLHAHELSAPILDDFDEDRSDLVEREADRLATDALISKSDWRSCPAKYTLDEKDVRSFAKKVGVAPQIVAGRLRRELRRHELFSKLINETNMREMLLGED